MIAVQVANIFRTAAIMDVNIVTIGNVNFQRVKVFSFNFHETDR